MHKTREVNDAITALEGKVVEVKRDVSDVSARTKHVKEAEDRVAGVEEEIEKVQAGLASNTKQLTDAVLETQHLFSVSALSGLNLFQQGRTAYLHPRSSDCSGLHKLKPPPDCSRSAWSLRCPVGCTFHRLHQPSLTSLIQFLFTNTSWRHFRFYECKTLQHLSSPRHNWKQRNKTNIHLRWWCRFFFVCFFNCKGKILSMCFNLHILCKLLSKCCCKKIFKQIKKLCNQDPALLCLWTSILPPGSIHFPPMCAHNSEQGSDSIKGGTR